MRKRIHETWLGAAPYPGNSTCQTLCNVNAKVEHVRQAEAVDINCRLCVGIAQHLRKQLRGFGGEPRYQRALVRDRVRREFYMAKRLMRYSENEWAWALLRDAMVNGATIAPCAEMNGLSA